MRFVTAVVCALVGGASAFKFSLQPNVLQSEYEAYINTTGLYNAVLPMSPFYNVWLEMYPENEFCYTSQRSAFYNPPFTHGHEDFYPDQSFTMYFQNNRLCEVTDTWPADMVPESMVYVRYKDTEQSNPPEQTLTTFNTAPQVVQALTDCEMFDGMSSWSHQGALVKKIEGQCVRSYYVTDATTNAVLGFDIVVNREMYVDYTNVVKTVISSYIGLSFGISVLDILIWGSQGRTEGAVLVHLLGNFAHLVLFGLPLAIIYTFAAAFYAVASCKLTLFRLVSLWYCPFGRTVAPVSLDEEDKENQKPFVCFSTFAFGIPVFILVLLRLPFYVLFIWSEVGKVFFSKLDDILAWSKDPFNKVVVFEPQAAAATSLLSSQYPSLIAPRKPSGAPAPKPRTDSFSSSQPPKPTEVAIEVGPVAGPVVDKDEKTETKQ